MLMTCPASGIHDLDLQLLLGLTLLREETSIDKMGFAETERSCRWQGGVDIWGRLKTEAC